MAAFFRAVRGSGYPFLLRRYPGFFDMHDQLKHIDYLRSAEIEAWKRWREAETAEKGAAEALRYATAELDKAVAAFVAPVIGSDTLEAIACRLMRQC